MQNFSELSLLLDIHSYRWSFTASLFVPWARQAKMAIQDSDSDWVSNAVALTFFVACAAFFLLFRKRYAIRERRPYLSLVFVCAW